MSHEENVEIARGWIDAFNRGDKAAFLALCDPDYENVPSSDWPESQPIRGREAVWAFFVQASDTWERVTYYIGELIEVAEDRLVFKERADIRGAASGVTVPWSYWVVMTFRAGKIRRSQWFSTRAEALEAAGQAA